MRLCVIHNLYFYNELMAKIREALDEGRFEEFYRKWVNKLAERSDDWQELPKKFVYKVKMSKPESIIPICIKENIDLGVPKIEKKKKGSKKKGPLESATACEENVEADVKK